MAQGKKTSQEYGAEGGKKRAARLSPEQRREIARAAAERRWQNEGRLLPKATHEGTLKIGDIEIECAVLEDGTRVITQSGFMKALGRARQAKGRGYYKANINMPAFLTAKNLKPFIPNELAVTSSQIEFRTVRGLRAYGYAADLLPRVCRVFLDAKRADELAQSQLHVANMAEIIVIGLAHVGIAALVDEATGYQNVRESAALRALLDKYLREELAAWAKRFPDEFYKQMFRLKGWSWSQGVSKRTHAAARYTNNLVYARIAPELLRELEAKNPKDERGNRRAKHHQWLTEDIGITALAQHLHAVIGLMRVSDDWEGFMKLMNRAFPRLTRLSDLPLFSGNAA